jgi:hypothetical protein
MPHRIRYIVERFCIPRQSIPHALERLSGLWLKYKQDLKSRFLWIRPPYDNRFSDMQEAFHTLGIFTGNDMSIRIDEAGNCVVVGHCRKVLEYEFEVFEILATLCEPCVIDAFGEDLDPWQWQIQEGRVRIVRLSPYEDPVSLDSDSDDILERLVRLKIDNKDRH